MIAIPLVTAIVGNFVGGFIGGYLGLTGAALLNVVMAGNIIGGLAGSLIASRQNMTVPGQSANGYPLQAAAPGTPIPRLFGTVKMAGNIIYMKGLIAYTITHKKKMLGITVSKTNVVNYRRSFLIALCDGPARVMAIWKGKDRIGLNNVTVFTGDGNSGMDTIIGDLYTKYANICCVYFQDFELGNTTTLPNFTFEVTSVTTGNYIYTITFASGNFTISRRTDNLDGTFTTTATLSGTGDTEAVFQDGNNYIYTIEGTDLKKYDSNLVLDTTWQTSGVKAIGAAFKIVAVNKNDNQVYYVSGATLYCLDSDGAELWSTALSNFNSVTCVGCFDKDDNLLMNVGASTGAGWYLVQHFNHTTGAFIRYHIPAGAVGDYVRAMSYNTYNDNVVIIGNVTTPYPFDSDERLISSPYNSQANYWNKEIDFESGGYLTTVYCSSIGDIFVGSTDDAIIGTVFRIILNKPVKFSVAFASLQVFTSGGDRKAVLQTNDTITYIGGYTKYEVLVGRKGVGQVIYAVYTDALAVLRSGTIAGTLTIAGDNKELVGQDVNAAEIIYTILTDPALGSVDASMIDTTTYNATRAYCEANDLNISIAMYTKSSVLDWLDVVNSHFFGYTLFTDSLIYIGVFKQEEPTFTITRDDIVEQIKVKDKDRSETSNHVVVKYTDRSMNYQANATAVADDWVDQEITGQTRDTSLILTGIMNAELAQKTADRYLAELMFRFSTFEITTSYKKMILKPGMVGTVEDKKRVINRKVRILSKQEIEDGKSIKLVVVEDGPHIYLQPNLNSSISLKTPAIAPLLRNPTITVLESLDEAYLSICIAPKGDVNGWQLLVSRDDDTYTTVEENIPCDFNQSRNSDGLIVSNMPAYPVIMFCPDDYVDVDIDSGQDIDSVSEVDFLGSRSLMQIGDEIVGFQTATDISDVNYPNRWRISKLIRGMFNTIPVAHIAGETFATLIENARIYYTDNDVAQTLYFIATPFYGTEIQPFEQCESIPYTVKGLYKRPVPVSIVRIDSTSEGIMEYSGATFTLEWNLGNKSAGFNIGVFNYDGTLWDWTEALETSGELPPWNDGIVFGSAPVESEISSIILQFYDNALTLLGERTLSGAVSSDTITNATDLGGGTNNYINVLPVSSFRTYYDNQILVTKI